MQEQRGLVEQPLWRFDALNDDAARHGVKLRILVGRQFTAGEHDNRYVGQRLLAAHAFKHLEAGHVRQAQVEHDAIARILTQDIERFLARAGADDLDVVVTEELADAQLLGGVVFDDQQTPAARLRELFDLGQRLGNPFASSSAW